MSVAAAHVPSRSSVARHATERSLALASIGLVGLHVVDDNFLQPEPGMTAVDHLPGGLALLALVAAGAWAYTRVRAGARAAIALLAGFLGVLAATEAVYYTAADAPSGDDFTGFLSLARRLRAARHRHSDALADTPRRTISRRRRYLRRGLVLVGVVVLIPLVLLPICDRLRRHPHCAGRRAGPESRRDPRGRLLHDERRAPARGLVRPLAERRHRDRLPRPLRAPEARAHARRARLRRAPLRPPRRGGERGRPEHVRLGRRPRPARGGRRISAAVPMSTRSGSARSGCSVGGEMLIHAAAHSDAFKAIVSEGRERPVDPRPVCEHEYAGRDHGLLRGDGRDRAVHEHTAAPEAEERRRQDRADGQLLHLRRERPGRDRGRSRTRASTPPQASRSSSGRSRTASTSPGSRPSRPSTSAA